MSDRRHEHSNERNTNKHLCLVHSIQNNPSIMLDNKRRSSCHHACQLCWLNNGNPHLPTLCTEEAPDEKLKINESGPNLRFLHGTATCTNSILLDSNCKIVVFYLDTKLWAGHQKGGHNRERKCRILRISPPLPSLRFVPRLRLQKGGRICRTLRYNQATDQSHSKRHL